METIKEKAEAYAKEQCGDYYNDLLNDLPETVGGFCVKDFTAGYESGVKFAEEKLKKTIDNNSFFITTEEGENMEIVEKRDLTDLYYKL